MPAKGHFPDIFALLEYWFIPFDLVFLTELAWGHPEGSCCLGYFVIYVMLDFHGVQYELSLPVSLIEKRHKLLFLH